MSEIILNEWQLQNIRTLHKKSSLHDKIGVCVLPGDLHGETSAWAPDGKTGNYRSLIVIICQKNQEPCQLNHKCVAPGWGDESWTAFCGPAAAAVWGL